MCVLLWLKSERKNEWMKVCMWESVNCEWVGVWWIKKKLHKCLCMIDLSGH